MSLSWKADTKTKEFLESIDNAPKINKLYPWNMSKQQWNAILKRTDQRIKGALRNETYDYWNKKFIQDLEDEDKETSQKEDLRDDIEIENRRER